MGTLRTELFQAAAGPPAGPPVEEVAAVVACAAVTARPDAPRVLLTAPCGTLAALADAEVTPGRGAAVDALKRRLGWIGGKVVGEAVVGEVYVLAVAADENDPAALLADAADDYLGPVDTALSLADAAGVRGEAG